MTNGPIKRYKDAQALNEKKRREAMEQAEGKKKDKEKKKNPYKPGTARYKMWERREADKK